MEVRSVNRTEPFTTKDGSTHNNGTSELRIRCCCAAPYSHDDTYFE